MALVAMVAIGMGLVMLIMAQVPISHAEAIRRAEAFIVRNGYTDLPPANDLREWMPEERETRRREEWPAARRGTLSRTAAGVGQVKDTIVVSFPCKKDPTKTGVVAMDIKGQRLQVVNPKAERHLLP
jgi:hypothetical protein